jgi:hypothetical protein
MIHDRTISAIRRRIPPIMNRPPVSLLFVLTLILAAGAFWLVTPSCAASETPEYKVVRTDGKFEIRDYPALTVATTPMSADGMNGGFGQLFRFITGSNEAAEKIEMTAPVLINTSKGQRTMSFIMPKKTVEKGVPKPSGDTVTLGKVEPARLAVFRFSGGRSTKNEEAAIGKLKGWLDAQKIAGQGEPVFAYYDPPWTLPFLRRNEVMIRINHAP